MLGQVGRAQQAAHRLAGDHSDGMDDAFRSGGDGVEAEDGAGRHHDLALMGAGELDQVVVAQQGAGAQHDQLLAGAQHRFGDVAEHGGGRAFDDHVALLVQRADGGEGGGAVGPCEGRRGLGVAHGDGGQREAGQPGVQGLRHGLADGAEAGDADAVAVHRDPEDRCRAAAIGRAAPGWRTARSEATVASARASVNAWRPRSAGLHWRLVPAGATPCGFFQKRLSTARPFSR
ncbi:hypothetical protein D9M68_689180 [compost metagenome]